LVGLFDLRLIRYITGEKMKIGVSEGRLVSTPARYDCPFFQQEFDNLQAESFAHARDHGNFIF
jgi:hypothetical protein